MILVGIDDTDVVGGPGTNQLARRIAAELPEEYTVEIVLRHQLLFDPRIPYTSGNGSASLAVRVHRETASTAGGAAERAFSATAPSRLGGAQSQPGDAQPQPGDALQRPVGAQPQRGDAELVRRLASLIRGVMLEHFQPGSDPGLCVATAVPPEVTAFGRRCQREPVRQEEARALARAHGIHLEGLGGTEDGVIGALAAVGLFAEGNDGRVVHMDGWGWPDDFTGTRSVEEVRRRGVDEVVELASGRAITDGIVDLGKRLRPAYRDRRVVLFIERVWGDGRGVGEVAWRALKLD